MSSNRNSGERLDALLTALEDEVLRSDQGGQQLADESVSADDVGAMRASIESMVYARTYDTEWRPESLRDADGRVSGPKTKVAQAMQRLGRWVAAQGKGAMPEVRMAFSGEQRERLGEVARKSTQCESDRSNDSKRKDG